MLGNNLIQKRVMAVVKEKINAAQTKYDEGVDALEDAHEEVLKSVKIKLQTDKVKLADDLVNGILEKIL